MMNAPQRPWLPLLALVGLAFGCSETDAPGNVAGPAVQSPSAAVVDALSPLRVKTAMRVTNPTAVEFLVEFVGLDPIENGLPKDIQLDLKTSPTGIVTPSMISLNVVSEAWSEDRKAAGNYVIEATAQSVAELPAVQIWEDSKVVADLSQYTEAFEARLRFDANAKAWVMIAELTSSAAPGMGLSLVSGAHTSVLTVGTDELFAGIRESQATFDIQPVF